MARDTSNIYWLFCLRLTGLLLVASTAIVSGQNCPVKDTQCICDSLFGRNEIHCSNLGNRIQVPPFGTSDEEYDSLTIDVGTAIQEVQDDAFSGLRIKTLTLSNLQIATLGERAFRGSPEEFLQSISLDGNSIAEILPDTFQNLTNLTQLSLSNNRIAALSPVMFRGLTNLEFIFLSNNMLSALPEQLFSDCRHLNYVQLNGNKFSTVSAAMFTYLSSMRQLDLSDNGIDVIEPDAFDSLSGLTDLIINNNALQVLNSSTFRGLTKLNKLDLSDNYISTVAADVFKELLALTYLDMADNLIEALDVQIFSNLRNLRHLYLQGNSLISLPDLLFSNQSKLQSLNLELNDIHVVTSQMFSSLSNLTSLQLNNNSIQELPTDLLQSLKSLSTLNLKANSIHSIGPGIFANCVNLSSIQLSYNKIDSVLPHTFENLPSLAYLYIDHNNISSLESKTFSTLPKLSFIDLSSNRLSRIEDTAFFNVTFVKTLFLDSNRLVEIPSSSLRELPALISLSLNWNGIADIPGGVFSGLPKLQRLSLSNNVIASVQRNSLEGLVSLQFLDLQNNKICSIPSGLFGSFLNSSLKNLYLSSNCISDISGALFSNLTSLTLLSLAGNKLTVIPNDAITGLNSIQELYLDRNNISFMSRNGISNLAMLQRLWLSENRLTSSALHFIVNLERLESLNLTRNLIEYIEDSSFSSCDNLFNLYLRNNKIERIGRFASANLNRLDLGYNRLNTSDGLADLEQFTSLGVLQLDGNAIEDSQLGNLRAVLQKNADTLNDLNLSNNKLTSDVFSVIKNLTALTSLNLDDNRIEIFPDYSKSSVAKTLSVLSMRNNLLTEATLPGLVNFTALVSLSLDGNNISYIPKEVFRNMLNLATLSLNRVGLKQISNDTFSQLSSMISELYLADNYLELVESGALLAFTNLKQLDLSGNQLRDLTLPEKMPQLSNLRLSRNLLEEFPGGLQSFRYINSIDLSENRIRVLPAISIYSSVQVRLLDFSENLIENIDATTYYGVIDRLNFSRNRISDIQTRIFKMVTSVNQVDFSWNNFQSVPAVLSIPHAAATIIDLNLDYNQISNLSDWQGSGSLQSKIERLSLRGNKLEDIPRSVLEALNASLIELDVRDNQLVILEESTFSNVVHLAKLYLEGNLLQCDCLMGWLRRLELTVDVGAAKCYSPDWVKEQLAYCYNISMCNNIDPSLMTIRSADCLILTTPSLTSATESSSFNASEDSAATTTIYFPSIPFAATNRPITYSDFLTSNKSSTTPGEISNNVTAVTSSVSIPSSGGANQALPYSRDGLIAGLVCGIFVLIVLIGVTIYCAKKRPKKPPVHPISAISNDVMMKENPGYSKI